MQTPLFIELFPDHCEVVEIPLHNQYIFKIQKNGTSSLRLQKEKHNLSSFVNDEILALDCVDVYIRNPRSRYVSGVNTFIQHLQRDYLYLQLDVPTSIWFAKRYKFLNTHYLPQFYWIASLSRYLQQDTKIRIRDFKNFGRVVDIQDRAAVTPPTPDFVKQLLSDDPTLELWLYLDQILLDLAGSTLTWSEILQHYQKNHKSVLEHVLPQA
jgi:hypothetical protein